MSASFHKFVAGLFGRPEKSDCTIVFYCTREQAVDVSADSGSDTSIGGPRESEAEPLQGEVGESQPGELMPIAAVVGQPESEDVSAATPARGDSTTVHAAKRQKLDGTQTAVSRPESAPAGEVVVGEPLPAHTLVLCGGSPRFQAQVDRLGQEAQPLGSNPVLRVLLGSADDLPHALSALRFMYSGALGVNRASHLLQLRRVAAELQVEDCPVACDLALYQLIRRYSVGGYGLPPCQSAVPVLNGVADLYDSRELLEDAAADRTFIDNLMDWVRDQLANPMAYQADVPAVSPGQVPVGELLAWAFSDAPAVLNNLRARQRMQALPLAAMEALLGSESFGTDDEATVLLLVAFWLHGRADGGDQELRLRLCRLIRLPQLNGTYLHRVLPNLAWFPIHPKELQLIWDYAYADYEKCTALAHARGLDPSAPPPWYDLNPRPKAASLLVGKEYKWCGMVDCMTMTPQGDFRCEPYYEGGTGVVLSHGFAWRPVIELRPFSASGGGGGGAGHHSHATARMHLQCCHLPDALQLGLADQETIVAAPASIRLGIHGCNTRGERQSVWSNDVTDETFVKIGGSICVDFSMPSVPPAAAAAQDGGGATGIIAAAAAGYMASGGGGGEQQQQQPDPLAVWRPHMRDGVLRCSLAVMLLEDGE